MVALSTYLGHTNVTDTYWYLEATPMARRRFCRFTACCKRSPANGWQKLGQEAQVWWFGSMPALPSRRIRVEAPDAVLANHGIETFALFPSLTI
jgi:hypothetical protein